MAEEAIIGAQRGHAPARAELSEEARAVVRALLYFDLFDHPLRDDELLHFCGTSLNDLDGPLKELDRMGSVQQRGELIALAGIDVLAAHRRERTERAEQRMPKAHRMSRLIGSFPYVRGVLLSGSISKGVLAEDGDIDYFVIAEPGRLWLARTLLMLYKKVFLLNSRRDFCVNYFVDTDHLAIEDRNLFTATEMVTLIPTHGPEACRDLFMANGWAWERFPNMPRQRSLPAKRPAAWLQRLLERLFGGGLGSALDDLCMHLTFLRWQRKFGHFDARTFELALRTRKYVSKHHPRSFQQRVLNALRERTLRFEDEHGAVIR